MLFNPFTKSTSKRPFYVIEHSTESERRSRSTDPTAESVTALRKGHNDSGRPGSSKSTGSGNKLSNKVVRTGHWVVAGPGVLIKPLEEEKGKEALQIALTNPHPHTFQQELQEAGLRFIF